VLVLLALLCVALAAQSQTVRQRFNDFKRQYGKVYTSLAEHEKRFQNFQDNLKKAEEHQKKNPRARFGVTKFSDLSTEEFSKFYLLKDFEANVPAPPPAKNFSAPGKLNQLGCSPDPTNYDWFAQCSGSCTGVYDQGQCGSCWAFSATETIESYAAISGNGITQLAMQQIVDCDTSGQDQGCNGGFPSGAYSYVEGCGGLDPLSDYPYTAQDGTCAFNSGEVAATVSGSNSISGEDGLYSQLSSSSGGPVSVCVDASSWSSYQGGVLTSCGNNVDHCVQATGYAQYGQSGAYWIVRNSWGESWGQSGFIWVAIGQDLCSIGDYATIVTAK